MKNDAANNQTAQDLVDDIFGGIPEHTDERTIERPISEDQLYDHVTRSAAEIITNGLDAIAGIKLRIQTGADPDLVQSFSTLIASTTSAIETLNKIQLQTKKAKDAENLERLRHQHKTEQIEQRSKLNLGDGEGGGNTNILIATREDIMNSLLKPLQDQARILMSNERETVDAESNSDAIDV